MEWLGNLLGIGATAASGGLFGVLGSVLGNVSKYFYRKQEQQWQREKWAQENKLQELQMKAGALETEQELAIESQKGSWRGLVASHQVVDPPSYKWVAAIKSLFRPFITLVLWVLAAWVFHQVVTTLRDLFSALEFKELVTYMVYSVFFAATTAAMWWFADRALAPPGLKNR